MAAILAGGLGTRLRPVLGGLPKCMAPVRGRPFLAYQLAWLREQGIKRVLLCTGYGHDVVRAYCGDGSAWGMEIQYSVEAQALGTAGALQLAQPMLRETFLALNGDTYFAADLSVLLAAHRAGGTLATVALVQVPEATRFGAVTMDADGYVTDFAEKQRSSASLINAGVYVFEPGVFAYFPKHVPLSLEKDVLPNLAAKRLLRGRVLQGYHIDIGTPESYTQFQEDVLRLGLAALGADCAGCGGGIKLGHDCAQ